MNRPCCRKIQRACGGTKGDGIPGVRQVLLLDDSSDSSINEQADDEEHNSAAGDNGPQSIVQIVPVGGDTYSVPPNSSGMEENGASSFSLQHVPGANTLSRSVSTIRKAETIHSDYQMHEQRLRKEHEQRAAKQRRHTQQRVHARMLLRRTKTLSKVEIFQDLNSDAIDVLLKLMEYEVHAKDTDIVTQGDPADSLFAIVRGHCGVFVDGTKVTSLKSLDMFGENSLVDVEEEGTEDSGGAANAARVRNATVTALSDSVQVLKLSRSKFDGLLASGKLGADVLEKAKIVSGRRHDINSNLRQ